MADIRIFYDGTIFDGQKYGGISRYFVELTREMNSIDGCAAYVVAPFYDNAHLSELSARREHIGKILGIRAKERRFTGKVRCIGNTVLTQLAVSVLHPTIFHKTYHSDDWPKLPRNTRRVTTIHDLIYEILGDELPETEILKARRQRDLETSDLVICVSENTKKDLLKYYKLDEQKVTVVYHGSNGLAQSKGQARARFDRPYLLYVGKRGSYKNFITLALAWNNNRALRDNYALVCFGGGPFDETEYRTYRELGVDLNEVRQVSGGDDTLASLYENAEVFVYPSKLEGFGFPPLEAMSLACPVICASSSCIPEVVGDAGLYFDPDSEEDLATALLNLLENDAMKSELIEKGKQRLAEFTWKKCALDTLSAYRSTL